MAKGDVRCIDCHGWAGNPSEEANTPDLTGYASREWLMQFLKDPSHERFYGKRNEMPEFGKKKILDEKSLSLLVDWLRGDWYDPNRPGQPVAPTTAPTTKPTTTQAVK